MQTFLPLPGFNASAQVLDNKRLGKQRVECLQMIGALTGRKIEGSRSRELTGRFRSVPVLDGDGQPLYDGDELVVNREPIYRTVYHPQSEWSIAESGSSWRNHPAVLMWEGHEAALLKYGLVVCKVWTGRGYRDTCAVKMRYLLPSITNADIKNAELPSWMGKKKFHRSHQSNLIRKDPQHYGPLWPDVPADLEYIWPKP